MAIKPSTVIARNKKVVFWTNVVTDGTFVESIHKAKVKYNNTRRLHDKPYPDLSALTHLSGSIIKLPKVNAHDYIAEELDIDNLMNDDQMLKFLDAYLQRPSIA